MRVCLISREYPPDTGWGGIGTYTYKLASTLKEAGHDVEVIALAHADVNCQTGQPSPNEQGILVHRAAWSPLMREVGTVWRSLPYSHYLMKSAVALWTKFIAVHEAKPFDVAEAPEHLAEALFPAMTKVCPLVVRLHTPHSKLVAEGFHNLRPSFDLQLVAIFERIAMMHADVLSSPSEDLARYVAFDCGRRKEDILVVRNPVDAERFSPEGRKALKADGKVTVLFVGRLEGRKGVTCLIDAVPDVIKAFPEARFVVIGADTMTAPGEKSMLQLLKSRLAASGAAGHVDFLNHVPHAEMPDYYRSADICVVPSLYDNAAYTVLEAMASGKPLVGTSAGGTPEYILHNETGLIVPPGDSASLCRALVELLEDEAKRQAFGAAARKRVLSSFERSIIAEQIINTYEIARQRYGQNKAHPLYQKPHTEILEDFKQLIYSYHLNLDELISSHSLSYRLKNWLQLTFCRPKLSFAKALVKMLAPFIHANSPHQNAIQRALIKLEREVSAKEAERTDLILKYLVVPPAAPESKSISAETDKQVPDLVLNGR
ncbi:MAG TPA: glycosyltransferase family 4 protein [Candidatus Obscuribacterales bacterium]